MVQSFVLKILMSSFKKYLFWKFTAVTDISFSQEWSGMRNGSMYRTNLCYLVISIINMFFKFLNNCFKVIRIMYIYKEFCPKKSKISIIFGNFKSRILKMNWISSSMISDIKSGQFINKYLIGSYHLRRVTK